jgi:hypothetical protein
MAINAVLAIIADGGRAIVVIYTEGEEINYCHLYFIDSTKTLWQRPRPTPCEEAPGRWGMFLHQNHGAGGGNGSIMVGMFVCLCLANQNPFKREFLVPARTDLGVKLLTR